MVDVLDYKMHITQLRGVRGRWRYASRKATIPKIAHPATAPPSVDYFICL